MAIARVGTDVRVAIGGTFTPPAGTDTLVIKVFASVNAPNDDGLGAVANIGFGDGQTGSGGSAQAEIYETNTNPDAYVAIGVFGDTTFTPGTEYTTTLTIGGTVVAVNEAYMVIGFRSGVDQTNTASQTLPGVVEAESASGTTLQPAALTTAVDGFVEYAVSRASAGTTMAAAGLAVDDSNDTLTDIRGYALSGTSDGTTIQPTFDGSANGSWAIAGVALNPAAGGPLVASIEFTAAGLGRLESVSGTLRANTEYVFEIRENTTGRTNTPIIDTVTATTDASGEVILQPVNASAIGGNFFVHAVDPLVPANGFRALGTYTGT